MIPLFQFFSVNNLDGNQVGIEGKANIREVLLTITPKTLETDSFVATSTTTTPIVTTDVPIVTTGAPVATNEKPCPSYFARTCSYKCTTMNNMYLCSCPAGYINKYHGYCRGMLFSEFVLL